jgi:hypothetical protein
VLHLIVVYDQVTNAMCCVFSWWHMGLVLLHCSIQRSNALCRPTLRWFLVKLWRFILKLPNMQREGEWDSPGRYTLHLTGDALLIMFGPQKRLLYLYDSGQIVARFGESDEMKIMQTMLLTSLSKKYILVMQFFKCN